MTTIQQGFDESRSAHSPQRPSTDFGIDHARVAYEPSPAVRWLLAALSIGAGAIHLAMIPQHAQASLVTGLAFAVAGWFQIAFGVAMAARPARIWVQMAIAANVAFLGAWALSRTLGMPAWAGHEGVESASSVDILCVIFEIGIVVGAIAILAAPDLLAGWKQPALVVASIIPAMVLVATTAVLASPSTAGHAHRTTDDHSTATGSDHPDSVDGSETADGSPTHDHDPAVPGAHEHADSTITYDQLPAATKAEVDQVIALWANKYPTAADATKDGWFKATLSFYGIGAHYTPGIGVPATPTFNLLTPNMLLFDGEGPDAKFAGVSYSVTSAANAEGFTGDYDVWHSHPTVCSKGGLNIVSLTEENSDVWLGESECIERGGHVQPIPGDLMMHLWIGPGYLNTAPIFAHDHPDLFDGFLPQRDA